MIILRYRLVSLISAFGLGLFMVCCLLLVFGRLASPATAAPLYAGPTTITQSVTVPTTWAAADSPFIISGTINVQSQLTISPSVVVSFTQGSQLVVQPTGLLLANGTSGQPIQFTSNPGTCYWEGVRLESNGNQIQYATFEYASQALKLESSNNHTIQFNTFQNNGGCIPQPSPLSGAIIGFSDNSLVSNNVFTSNHTAIYLTRSGGNLISGNIISGTTTSGIHFPSNPATASQDNQILNNTVRYAGEYGISLARGIGNSIVGNSVYQNGIGGVYLENQTPNFGSAFLVQQNNIYSNTGPALTISQTVSISLSNNLIWDNSSGVLWDVNNNGAFSGYGLTSNVICNNTDYLFRNNDTSPPFTTPATPNWWGTNTPTAGVIASSSDIEGDVNIDPRMIFTATSAITSIPADGVSTTVVTISLQSSGLTVPSAARTVNLSTNLGTLSANQVTLDASGVATVTLQSAATPGTATITAVEFCGFPVTTTVEFLATDVGIAKTATISQVIPSQTVTYTIAYSNATAVAATNVVITDTLPTDLQFVSDDSLSQGFSRTVNGQTVVWSHPSLGGNVSGVISLVAQLPQTATTTCGQTLTNSAVITTSTIDSNSSNDSSSDSSVTVICADVGIQKTTTLSQVALGDTMTYTIAYSNSGTATADNVIITDTLPAGTGYVSDTSGLGVVIGSGVITWPVGSLASGGNGSFELVLSTGGASCGDSLSNAASISTTTPESDTTNNGPSIAGSISVLCSDVQINKSTVLTQVMLGNTVTYTLAYSNTGGVSATNVIITDTLPAGTGYISDTSGLGVVTGSGVVTWNVGVLNSGTNNSFEVVLSTAGTTCGDSLINTAGIDTTTPDSNLANNSDTASSVDVTCADVTLTKVAPANIVAGTTVTYTIFYTNIGTAAASSVIITDAHPITGGIDTLVSGATLNPNQSGSISYPVYVDPAICGANPSTTITNTAYISTGTPESNSANNVSTVSSAVQCIPNLIITKTLGAPAMSLGKPVTFTIAYENAGVITAPNTVITDFLSVNVSYVTDTFSTAPVTTTSTVQWSLGDVAPGGSGSFEVSLLYDPPLCVGSIFFVNRAAISSTLPDTDPSNNSDLESSGVIPCDVDLVVLKNDGVGGPSERPVVLAGDVITYTITYLNAGGETATGVVLTETLPAYTQFVGPTGANGWFQVGASSLYTYNLGTLAASTGNKLNFVVQVVPTLPATVTVVNNQIEIDGNEVDAFPSDNISFEQTPVQAAPDLRVEKAAVTPVANPGGQVTYVITVTNQGALTATNVFITDTLPANTSYASNTIVGAPVSVSGSTVVWDVGQIDPAQTISFNLTLDVAAGTAICSSSNLINTVEAFGDAAEGNLGNNTASTTALNSPVVACRDIAITKSVDDPQTTLNRDVIFTLTYSNPGLITSTSTLITDVLPSGISFVQSNPTHSGPFGGVYQWPVGDLLPGITGTVVITGRVDNNPALCGQTLTNTAGITGTISGDDEFLGNNQSSVDVTVLCVPDLVTVKNDGIGGPAEPPFVQAGDVFTYSILYSNIGIGPATGVVLTETLPNYTSFVGPTGLNGWFQVGATNQYTYSLGTVNSGAGFLVNFAVQVENPLTMAGNFITNTVCIGTGDTEVTLNNNCSFEQTFAQSNQPRLNVTKSATPASGSTVQPGQTITYTVVVLNDGQATANNVLITDTLPLTEVGFITATLSNGSPVNGPNPLTANVSSLAVNESVTMTVVVTVNNVISGTLITNTAQAIADALPVQQSNTVTHTTISTAGLPPTLIIQKVADPPSGTSINPGSLITYTVWITNQSLIALVDATNVVITDVIPNNTTYAGGSASATQGTITVNPGSLVADIGTVAANQTVTFTFQVTVTTPLTNSTQITNTADVSADLFGPQQTNTVTHTVTSAPLLSISKLSAPVSGATVDPGDPIIYFILVANNGDATATNVTITDTLPISTEFVLQQLVPPIGAVTGPDPLVANIPSLAGNGGTVVFRFAVTVTNSAPVGLIIPNQAQISSDQTTVTNTNVVTHIVSVVTPPTATLAISKVAEPVAGSTITAGSSITYTITVTNTGAAAQTNVSIFDILDANTTLVFSSTTPSVAVVGTNPIFATWPTLAAGDTVTMVLRVDVAGGLPDGTIVTNSATGFSNESPLVATGPVTHVISSLPLTPSLVISKTATPVSGSLVNPGQFITYTITARNTSGVTVNNVVISDTLDANVTLVNSSTTTGTVSGPNPIQVSGFNLAAGESVTVTLGVTVTGNVSGTIINNTASVTSPQILSMQTSGLVTHVISSTIPPTSNLVIAKAAIPASGSQVEFGDTITYTIVVLNTGAGAETNVVISDTLDVNVALVTSNTTGGAISGPNPLQVSIPTLNGGQSITVTLGVTVTGNVSGTIINNRAGVSSDQTMLPQVTGVVTHIISSTITASPGLTLTKSANPPSGTPVSPGDSITYTIVVSNGSGSAATNVVVTDTIPANTAFVPGSQSTTLGGIGFDGSRITVTVSSLPASVAFTTTFRVTVTTNLTTTITNIASVNSDQTTVTNSNVVTHPVLGTGSLNIYLPIIYKDFFGPSASMSWLHQVDDRVSEVDGSNASAFTADGRNDGAFLVTVNSGAGAKTINNVVLTSSQGGSASWDTIINGVPVLGIFDNTTQLNNSDGTISQMVNGSVTVAIYASDDAGGTRFPEDTYDYTVTINFTDGTSATATARIPVTPPPPPPVCDVVADIAVGNTPRGVAIDSTRNRAYVANFGSSSVSVIDTNSNTVLQTLSPITGANGIAYDATQNIIWVTNQSSNQVTPIQADAGAANFTILSSISVGSSPWGVTHDPVHNYVYVVNNGGDSVTVIDASAQAALTTLSGSFNQPYHVAADTVTGKVYVPNFGNHTVTVIDGTSVSSVVDLTAGDPSTQPYGVAVDETRELVYVSTVDSHRVVVIGRLGGLPDQLLGWAAFHRGFNDPSRPVPLRAIAINPDIGPISPMDDGGHVWLTTSTADGSEANQALLSRKGWSGYFHSPVPCDVGTNPSEGIAIDRALDRAFVTSGTNPGTVMIIVDNPDPPLVPFLTEDGISVEVFTVE